MPVEESEELTNVIREQAQDLAELKAGFATEKEKRMSEAGVKATVLAGGVQEVVPGEVDPFDVWWGTLSDAMKLASPVIVAREAYLAGQRDILLRQAKRLIPREECDEQSSL